MGTDADAGQNQNTGADPDAGGNQSGAQNGPDAGDKGGQPDVDKIVAARVAQKLKQYGDLDELRKAKDELDKIKQDQLSESERLQQQLAAAEDQRKALEEDLRRERVGRTVEAAAAKAGFVDPDLVPRLLDMDQLELDESGTPKADSLKAALDDLAKQRPYLRGTRTPGDPDAGVRNGDQDPPKDFNQMLRKAAGRA